MQLSCGIEYTIQLHHLHINKHKFGFSNEQTKPLTFSDKSLSSMAEISGITVRTQTTILNIEDGRSGGDSRAADSPCPLLSISLVQKVFYLDID